MALPLLSMVKFNHSYHIWKIFRHCQISKFTSKWTKWITNMKWISFQILHFVLSVCVFHGTKVNYKLCKLLQICLQRPLYFFNVPNYNWLQINSFCWHLVLKWFNKSKTEISSNLSNILTYNKAIIRECGKVHLQQQI